MDTSQIVTLIQESLFMVVTFSVFLTYAMWKGRYALINVLFALYLALLISIKFPYYNVLTSGVAQTAAIIKILIFACFIIIGVLLFRRHIPGDDYEPAFHKLWKKVLLSLMATILVMIFSFHALPVTEIITPGTPIQSLFAPQENFFWWLILPIVSLFLV